MTAAPDTSRSTVLTDVEILAAKRIWDDYQKSHDVQSRKGQIAGIDPSTGGVWIGEWFNDVPAQRDAAGINNLLFFERIGFSTAIRKGGRR